MTSTAPGGLRSRVHTPLEHARALAADYGEDRPLGAYALLAGVYSAITVAGFGSAVARRRMAHPSMSDTALLAVGAFKLSRVLSKAKVTAFLRAPFAQFEEESDGPEVNESPRGSGLRLAIGELLTCPFCLTQWTGTLLSVSWMHAPNLTRLGASALTVTSAADALHVGWCRFESL